MDSVKMGTVLSDPLGNLPANPQEQAQIAQKEQKTLIRDLDFPRSCNKELWESYLERELTQQECFILGHAHSEKLFNARIDSLEANAKEKNLYIPELTKLHGNCLFESLMYYKLFDDHDEFRKDLAYFMYMFGDYKNFFPGQQESLKELFTLTNEVEYVYANKTDMFYKYTYSTMCIDLFTEFSWTRLPTELIMMVISYIFNIKIHTVSNATDHNKNNYVSEICCAANKDKIMDVYLGHIGEVHYVPLAKIPENQDTRVLRHTEAKKMFFSWAYAMCKLKHKKEEERQKEKQKEAEQKEAEQKEQKEKEPEFKQLKADEQNYVSF